MNVDPDDPPGGAPSQEERERCEKEIEDIRRKRIAERGWPPREARRHTPAVWISYRYLEGRIGMYHYYEGDTIPRNAVKAFKIATPGGMEVPREVKGLLLRLFKPKATILGILSVAMDSFDVPVPNEDLEVAKIRQDGQLCSRSLRWLYRQAQVRRLTMAEQDEFAMAVLKVDRNYHVLRLYRDLKHRDDNALLLKIKGRSADKRTRRLEAAYLRNPEATDEELAKDAGAQLIRGQRRKTVYGNWVRGKDHWKWGDLPEKKNSLTVNALRCRIASIKKVHGM